MEESDILCSCDFQPLLFQILFEIKTGNIKALNEFNHDRLSMVMHIAACIASNIFGVNPLIIKHYANKFSVNIKTLASYYDLNLLYIEEIHKYGLSGISYILNELLLKQKAYHSKKDLNIVWKNVFEEIFFCFDEEIILQNMAFGIDVYFPTCYKSQNIEKFLKFFEKIFNIIFCNNDKMKNIDYSIYVEKYKITEDVMNEVVAYCIENSLKALFIVEIFHLIVNINETSKGIGIFQTYGGGNKRANPGNFTHCKYKAFELKYLKRAAELLISNEDKYSFLILNENVEKGIFIDLELNSDKKLLEYLIEFKFCTSRQSKKLSKQQIKNNITRLNYILSIKESQDYLHSVIDGIDINNVPKFYELHSAKRMKIDSSIFNEGRGIVNNAQSCFMISALQMLFHLEIYIEELIYRNFTEGLSRIEEEMKHIFAESQETNNNPINIKTFETLLMKEDEMRHFFVNGKSIQSDSSEFLQILHHLIKNEYKQLFQAPKIDEFLSEIFLDINFENIALNGFNKAVLDSFTTKNHNPESNESSILLIRLPRMEVSERNKKIKVPQYLDINGIQFEFKSAICHTGIDNNGHYTNCCKTLYSNEYYEFSDAEKMKIKNFLHLQEIIESKCFIIAYEKQVVITMDENLKEEPKISKIERRNRQIKVNMQKLRAKKKKAAKRSEKASHKAKRNEALLEFRKKYLEQFKNGKSKNVKFSKVLEDINEVPSVICDCCYRLIFKPESVQYNLKNLHKKYNENCQVDEKVKEIEKFKELVNRTYVTTERRLCSSCHDSIRKGKIPVYGPKDGLKFLQLSDTLKELTDLEERLISPILPFLQVRDLKPFSLNTFQGAKGPVVNIQVHIPNSTKVLPRKFNEVSVLQIMLKRKLTHHKYYMYETVSVKRILDALSELKDTPIYKALELNIDENVFKEYDPQRIGDHINFISDKDLISEANQNSKPNNQKSTNGDRITLEDCDDNDNQNSSFQKENLKATQTNDLSDEELKEIEALEKHLKNLYGREGRDNDFMILKLPTTAFECECEKEADSGDDNSNDANKRDEIKVIAPGENKKPILAKDIPDYDEKCFPSLYGGHPLDYNREKISKTKRYKHQIQNYDRRYTVPKCLFNMGKIKLEYQLQTAISIACRMGKCKNLTAKDVLNPDKMKELFERDDFYRFMKKVTLSPAYLDDKKKNTFAFFRQIGFPSFFLTLGPAESFWPELLMQLYKNKYNKEISEIDALNLPDEEKGELVRNDPVLCVQFFERRCKKVGDYLKTANNKVFGKHEVTDEIARREQQNRGFPHTHRILFNNDMPTYRKDMSEEEWKELQSKIDSIITTEYDVTNPNIFHQVHLCTFTCYKYKKGNCRFKFPRYPVKETIVLEPLEKKDDDSYKAAKENLKRIKTQIEEYRKLLKEDYNKRKSCEVEDDSFIKNFDEIDDMLLKLNLTYDQYLFAIRSELTKPSLYYKRKPNAIEINNYNTNLLNMWGANMDLQYVLDCYAAAKYLFSYILKSDSGLIRLLHEALDESKDANLNQRATLRKIANAFNNAIILGAAQIADYILGTPVTKFSRACVFINTGPKEKNIKILKQNSKLQAMDEDDEDVFEKGLLDHYANRSGFKNLCLADFTAKYSITLKNNKVELKERKAKPKVIRYVKYNKDKNPEMYYREQLMLYRPWENYDDFDIKEGKSFAKIYENFKKNDKKGYDEFCKIRKSYNENIFFDENVEMYLEQIRKENEEEEERAFQRYKDDEVECVDAFPGDDVNVKKGDSGVGYAISIPPRIPNDEFMENMRMLNSLQRAFLYEIKMCCIKNNMNRLFLIQGTAGTGKSFMIKSIYQMVTKHFDERPGNTGDKESCKVLLTASTGVAAFLLSGVTYHSAFKFSKYTSELSESVASTIRQELRFIEVLIIDEISMMSVNHLYMIDKRMQMVFGNEFPFGGKMVILVGDLLQLRPVSGRPIYSKELEIPTRDTKKKFENYDKDSLWELVEMHELIQVVRQKDERYVKVLDNMAHGCMTDDDEEYIKQREVKDLKDVPEYAVHLFYLNKHVDAFNQSKLDRIDGNLIIVESCDTAAEETLSPRQKEVVVRKFLDDLNNDIRIPHNLHVKLNVKYMIPVNIDLLDGLVNGVIGVCKFITNDSKNEPFILWLDFDNEKIGKKRREKYKIYQENNSEISPNWVPIVKECVEIQKSKTNENESLSKNRIIRKQFPLTMSESISVHKSQGQTLRAICVDFTKGNLKADLLFVAFSRTDYNGLYILGNFKKPVTAGNVSGINEINRLRSEAKIKFSFDLLENISEGFVIIYQNIQKSYNPKAKYVIADNWYKRGDVVVFSEANVTELTSSQIMEGFVPLYPLKEHNFQSKINRGLVIMAKKERNITIHKMEIYESNEDTEIHLDLKSFIIEDHYIITGYKTPKTNTQFFKEHLQQFINEVPSTKFISIIGDFNLESGKSERFLNEILHNLIKDSKNNEIKFHNQLTSDDETTIRGTQIDIVFSSSIEGNGGVYPTYFSDHHAVFYRSKKSIIEQTDKNLQIAKRQTKPARKPKEQENNLDKTSKRKRTTVTTTENTTKNKKNCIERNSDDVNNLEVNNNRFLIRTEKFPSQNLKFPNQIFGLLTIRYGIRGYYDFYNLNCFNSCYHGFLYMFENNNRFRAECMKDKSPSIFNLLHNRVYKSFENGLFIQWIQLLTRYFEKNAIFVKELFDGTKKFKVNMEEDALNLFKSFEGESFIGSFKSCHKQIICNDCQLVLDDFSFKNILLTDVQKKHFENFTQFIEHSLDQTMNCLDDCNGIANSLIRYNYLVIFSIKKDLSDGSACFIELKLNDLPQEIVLPYYYGGQKKIYELQFVQNYRPEWDGQPGHYTTVLNCQEFFLELGEINIPLPTERPWNYFVNPHTMVYLEVNNEELIKSKVFENTFEFELKVSELCMVSKKLTNMCCFNSLIHGLIRLYRKNKSFQEHIMKNEECIPLFPVLYNIVHSKIESERNSIWGQFLYDLKNFSKNFEDGNMFDADVKVVENIFNGYFSYFLKCSECDQNYLNLNGDKFGHSYLSIKVTQEDKLVPNIFLNLIFQFFNNFGNRKKCKSCSSKLKIEIGKMFIVHIDTSHFNYSVNQQGPELNFSQLPQTFEINGNVYNLSSVMHYIPGRFHFTTKYKLTNETHLEIDDDGSVSLIDNNQLVNPKVLMFIRKT